MNEKQIWRLESKNLSFSGERNTKYEWTGKTQVFWWETPNLFEWTRKNIGFLMREDKLQPLQINEIDYHSKLLNRWCERFKTIEKTEKNTSSCKRMYFELPLKSFFYIFECRMGLSSTEPAKSNTIKIKLLWEKLAQLWEKLAQLWEKLTKLWEKLPEPSFSHSLVSFSHRKSQHQFFSSCSHVSLVVL